MTRKILNDVRSLLSKKGYLNTHRMVNEDLSKPNNLSFPRTSSRFLKNHSRSELKKSLRNKDKKII